MIELLAGACGILAALLIIAVVFAITYRQERDEMASEVGQLQLGMKTCEAIASSTNEILNNRITTLKGDNAALEAENKRLGAENTDLQRENGRFAGEIRALKQEAAKRVQPRDPATGRMLPNPNAKRPRKSRAKDAPIACG